MTTCERRGCNNGGAEVSRIGGIIRWMCFECTKKMVMEDREKNPRNGVFR